MYRVDHRRYWTGLRASADCSAYSRYLVFFHEEITRLGPLGAVDEYVFSPQAVSDSMNSRTQLTAELGESEWT